MPEAEAIGDATVVNIDVEALVRELSGGAGAPEGGASGAEVFDVVIERIAGEIFAADLVVLAAATVGPAELVAAGAVDGLGGSLSSAAEGLGPALSRQAGGWQMPDEAAWTPQAVASPLVAMQLAATLEAALSAPVAAIAGAVQVAERAE